MTEGFAGRRSARVLGPAATLLLGAVVLAVACQRGSERQPTTPGRDAAAGPEASVPTDVPADGVRDDGLREDKPRDVSVDLDLGSGAGSPWLWLPPPDAASVIVHLFEWRWSDIALECERFLGPRGFAAVQISPPSEHSVRPEIGSPWWQRYQTVSYDLAKSRSGTVAEFRDMVSRCAEAGVAIYADAVINHMTALDRGVGSNGTLHGKYSYPGLYEAADFHQPPCGIGPGDYANNADAVRRCELVGLADLDTAKPTVRDKIAAYLIHLFQLGVRGIRVDAAKHMPVADVDAIIRLVDAAVAKGPAPRVQPYVFLEVIDQGGEAVRAAEYLSVGQGTSAIVDITEFKYGIGPHFLGRNGQSLAHLLTLSSEAWGLLPSDRALVFTNNHDTQRADAVYYADGAAHDLANVFMLAWPYGRVVIASSYAFDRSTQEGRDDGPPADGAGATRPVYPSAAGPPSCAPAPARATTGTWVCEHRQRGVANMVRFRRVVGGAPVTNVWHNGGNQIAFGRGDKGFVAINRDPAPLRQRLATGLPAGVYCDVVDGDLIAGMAGAASTCAGGTLVVESNGQAMIDVAANTAGAFHIDARIR